MLSFGFPPIATTDARVLILGSLPGQQSLQASEYYAHPRNAFWKIMGVHLGSLPESYAARVLMVSEAKVALWDVLAAATRSGSLDADIEKDAVANNFRVFSCLSRHTVDLFQRGQSGSSVRSICRAWAVAGATKHSAQDAAFDESCACQREFRAEG